MITFEWGEKIIFSTSSNDDEMDTSFNDEQLQKELTPILFTLDGITIFFNEMQFPKANSSISTTDEGIKKVSKDSQP